MYLGSSWIYIARNVIFDEITVPCAHNKILLLASNTSQQSVLDALLVISRSALVSTSSSAPILKSTDQSWGNFY